jgi:transcriptional regulator with XRE-family HTH domain
MTNYTNESPKKVEIEPGKESEYFRAALIHALHMRKDLNQTSLAKRAETSQQYVNYIYRGTREGTEETRRKISVALGVSYERMLEVGRELHESGKFFDGKSTDEDVDLFVKKAQEYREARERSSSVDLGPLRELFPNAVSYVKSAVRFASEGEGGRTGAIAVLRGMVEEMEKYKPTKAE